MANPCLTLCKKLPYENIEKTLKGWNEFFYVRIYRGKYFSWHVYPCVKERTKINIEEIPYQFYNLDE